MRDFNEFLGQKHNDQFESDISFLMAPVLFEQMSFEELTENVIVPTFVNSTAETAEEILIELNENLKDKWNDWSRWMQGKPVASKDPGHQKMSQSINQGFQSLIQKQLIPVIDSIKTKVQNSAYKINNRHLYKAAELFADKLKNTANSVKFQVYKATNPSPEDKIKDQFKQGRSAWNAKNNPQPAAAPQQRPVKGDDYYSNFMAQNMPGNAPTQPTTSAEPTPPQSPQQTPTQDPRRAEIDQRINQHNRVGSRTPRLRSNMRRQLRNAMLQKRTG